MGVDQHPPGIRPVRIFLASSEELVEHRREFELFISRQNKRFKDLGVFLELVIWEDFLSAMSATRSQDEYNKALQGCDLFVLLFCSKVGKYTAEEFECAHQQFKATGRPLIWTYFHDAAIKTGQLSRAETNSLFDFQDKLKELGHFQTVYDSDDALCRDFGDQLAKLESEKFFERQSVPSPAQAPKTEPLTQLQQTTLTRLLAEPAFRLDEAEAVTLRQQRPAGLRGHLLQRWAEWCTGEGGRLERRFVNLTLLVDQGREFQGERYANKGSFDRLADLLRQHADVHSWVLVGDPGAGKSTVLQHHELNCAREALQTLASAETAAQDGAPPEVCVWHRLSEYSVDSPAPAEWLAQRWPQELPPPAELGVRLRYLLDGLNEIKAPTRAAQLQAVERWTSWAAEHSRQSGALAPIFSVRTLDQSPMSLGTQFEVRQIVLEPWKPEQIERFCAVTLGDGNALWPAISSDAELLKLYQLPFNLAAQCRLFRSLGRPATDRAELMGGLFWEMLTKRQGDPALKPAGLLGDESRQIIASRRWVEHPRALPDDDGCLVPWLDRTAQRLQRQGRQVSEPRKTLLAKLRADEAGWATPADWLAAVRSLKLLGDGEGDAYSTTPPLRFVHQLWQEFFAARGIRDLPTVAPEHLPDLRTPELPPLDETLAQLGAQEPLPGPDPSHWEEPVKLAVQLVPNPLPWIEVLQPQNLALAGRAAVASRQRLEQVHGPAVLDGLRQALLARSRDPAVDVRLRIEAGLILGELGDPRYEERQGPHGRYLWPKQWVRVPGGVYCIGDENSDRPDEKPETDVPLGPFEMAFAPVTNAEYRCFIEAGGYEAERWWVGETAQRWRREGIRNEQSIQDWTTWLAALREDFDAGVRRYFPGATAAWIETDLKVYAAWSEEEAQRNIEESFGGQIYREPGFWSDARFNAPSQPVVGITVFEAQAYACWLAAQGRQPVRLPVEAEWEAAARGTAAQRWPWGDADAKPQHLNADPTHLRHTSPVGVFPDGDSPTGLCDLAGNVWEWTTSAYTEHPEPDALTCETADPAARPVVRGGAWSNTIDYCRASFRDRDTPDYRGDYLGFRLVVSCPIPGTEP